MAPNPRRVEDRLEAVYARLPRMACKGKCAVACVADFDAEPAEWERMRRIAGDRPKREDGMCGYLGADGRCSVYAARPLVCRAWGAVETMPCTHGCLAAGERELTFAEFFGLMADAAEASGDAGRARVLRDLLADPEKARVAEGIARRGQEISFRCPICRNGTVHGQIGSLGRCDGCGEVLGLEW